MSLFLLRRQLQPKLTKRSLRLPILEKPGLTSSKKIFPRPIVSIRSSKLIKKTIIRSSVRIVLRR